MLKKSTKSSEKYAIIESGGKQYKVSNGDKIEVEKIEKKEGSKVEFKALLISDDKTVKVGNPYIKDVKVEGKILEQKRAPKVWGIKFKSKKRYKRKFGHKQRLTVVEIVKV